MPIRSSAKERALMVRAVEKDRRERDAEQINAAIFKALSSSSPSEGEKRETESSASRGPTTQAQRRLDSMLGSSGVTSLESILDTFSEFDRRNALLQQDVSIKGHALRDLMEATEDAMGQIRGLEEHLPSYRDTVAALRGILSGLLTGRIEETAVEMATVKEELLNTIEGNDATLERLRRDIRSSELSTLSALDEAAVLGHLQDDLLQKYAEDRERTQCDAREAARRLAEEMKGTDALMSRIDVLYHQQMTLSSELLKKDAMEKSIRDLLARTHELVVQKEHLLRRYMDVGSSNLARVEGEHEGDGGELNACDPASKTVREWQRELQSVDATSYKLRPRFATVQRMLRDATTERDAEQVRLSEITEHNEYLLAEIERLADVVRAEEPDGLDADPERYPSLETMNDVDTVTKLTQAMKKASSELAGIGRFLRPIVSVADLPQPAVKPWVSDLVSSAVQELKRVRATRMGEIRSCLSSARGLDGMSTGSHDLFPIELAARLLAADLHQIAGPDFASDVHDRLLEGGAAPSHPLARSAEGDVIPPLVVPGALGSCLKLLFAALGAEAQVSSPAAARGTSNTRPPIRSPSSSSGMVGGRPQTPGSWSSRPGTGLENRLGSSASLKDHPSQHPTTEDDVRAAAATMDLGNVAFSNLHPLFSAEDLLAGYHLLFPSHGRLGSKASTSAWWLPVVPVLNERWTLGYTERVILCVFTELGEIAARPSPVVPSWLNCIRHERGGKIRGHDSDILILGGERGAPYNQGRPNQKKSPAAVELGAATSNAILESFTAFWTSARASDEGRGEGKDELGNAFWDFSTRGVPFLSEKVPALDGARYQPLISSALREVCLRLVGSASSFIGSAGGGDGMAVASLLHPTGIPLSGSTSSVGTPSASATLAGVAAVPATQKPHSSRHSFAAFQLAANLLTSSQTYRCCSGICEAFLAVVDGELPVTTASRAITSLHSLLATGNHGVPAVRQQMPVGASVASNKPPKASHSPRQGRVKGAVPSPPAPAATSPSSSPTASGNGRTAKALLSAVQKRYLSRLCLSTFHLNQMAFALVLEAGFTASDDYCPNVRHLASMPTASELVAISMPTMGGKGGSSSASGGGVPAGVSCNNVQNGHVAGAMVTGRPDTLCRAAVQHALIHHKVLSRGIEDFLSSVNVHSGVRCPEFLLPAHAEMILGSIRWFPEEAPVWTANNEDMSSALAGARLTKWLPKVHPHGLYTPAGVNEFAAATTAGSSSPTHGRGASTWRSTVGSKQLQQQLTSHSPTSSPAALQSATQKSPKQQPMNQDDGEAMLTHMGVEHVVRLANPRTVVVAAIAMLLNLQTQNRLQKQQRREERRRKRLCGGHASAVPFTGERDPMNAPSQPTLTTTFDETTESDDDDDDGSSSDSFAISTPERPTGSESVDGDVVSSEDSSADDGEQDNDCGAALINAPPTMAILKPNFEVAGGVGPRASSTKKSALNKRKSNLSGGRSSGYRSFERGQSTLSLSSTTLQLDGKDEDDDCGGFEAQPPIRGDALLAMQKDSLVLRDLSELKAAARVYSRNTKLIPTWLIVEAAKTTHMSIVRPTEGPHSGSGT